MDQLQRERFICFGKRIGKDCDMNRQLLPACWNHSYRRRYLEAIHAGNGAPVYCEVFERDVTRGPE